MTTNKKIAFLCHPYHRGGVTRWMADAAIAFANKGWEVYFATVEPAVTFFSGKGRETLLQLLQKGNAPVRIISVQVGREFEFGTQEYRSYVYRKLLLNVPQATPVILSDDDIVWDAATFLHNTYPLIGVLHADEPYYYKLGEKYAPQVSALVCVSERVKKTIVQGIKDFDTENIYTIPCGINLPVADFTLNKGNVLQLVYVGRISEYQKRVSDLVKVCALLKQRGQVFHLNIIGDGSEKVELENKFKEAGLSSLVTLHGWLSQKEVNKWLTESDILILTSDFEGTPIAMMEGLAAGCGLVGTRVSGIEDYELHPLAQDCVALFDVGNIEEAVSKITKVAAVPVNTRQPAARKVAEAEFSMDVCLDRYTQVIDRVKTDISVPAAKVGMPVQAIAYSRVIAWARSLKVSMTNK